MKLYSTFSKLPLMALLSIALASTPLVANADGGGHGKSHRRAEHQRDYRDYGHRRNNGYRHGYRDGYSDGYGDSYRPPRHYARYYGHGYRREHVGFLLGVYSDNLDIVIRD
ncbi:MAG: hypothetical protein BMS9Abin08_1225 [Gammaproteobacteria bacterium]|nr:MAG: hypothetical protein BMS9Abin08_1225 [Gammaproteobacteria bacterium]